ncbi:endolytic transglycosylase MltG [Aestuariimicrobium sp. Y1814]|uniref:endolytic transglycosylase MltG n=1 Tax=Aestuariimicrobium sp. Y1814 TaxID=3418742 RepID=UPI003DA7144B
MSGLFVENQGPNWKKILYHAKSAFAVLLSVAVLVGMGWFGYKTVRDAYLDYKSEDDYLSVQGEPVVFTVPQGASVNQIGALLVEEEIIKSEKAWKSAVAKLGAEPTFQAGRYNLNQQMPAAAAAAILSDPNEVIRVMVTIPEGLRMTDQWPLITKAIPEIKQADLEALGKDPKALGLPAWAGNKAEGFLYPETYQVDDTPTAQELLTAQVAQFTKVTTELNFEDRATSLGLTPMQALTIASIAEKEAIGTDMAMVTQVFYNRIAKNMPLQSDATVVYANNIKGRLTTTDEERAVDSPYNTYKYPGIPPGPIGNPGQEALTAALNPTQHDYLYFVVVDPSTGETEFNTTFEGHERSRAKFLAWCQANQGKC